MSLTVSHGCWLCLTVSPVPWNFYMSIIVAGCLSLFLPVPWIYWLYFTVCNGCWLSLTVSTIP